MKKIVSVALFIILAMLPNIHAVSACTVCHSKNPKMVRMHEALEYKDCFKCHGPASGRKQPNEKSEMTTDLLCKNCHTPEAGKIP